MKPQPNARAPRNPTAADPITKTNEEMKAGRTAVAFEGMQAPFAEFKTLASSAWSSEKTNL